MTKVDRLTSEVYVFNADTEYMDVQHLSDEDVADVAGGPEFTNTGGES